MASLNIDTQDKALTRDLLLEAASVLMRERDKLDISLMEIAEKVGVNAALVRYYFGNKLGLMMALLDRDLSPGMEAFKTLVNMDGSPTMRMNHHLSGLIKLYFRYPYLNRLIVSIMQSAPSELAQSVADKFLRPVCEGYDVLLTEGASRGEFKQVDSKLFYFLITGACDQIFSAKYALRYVYGISDIDDDLRQAYVAQARTIILNGLLAPKV